MCTSYHFAKADNKLMQGPAYALFTELAYVASSLAIFQLMHFLDLFGFMDLNQEVNHATSSVLIALALFFVIGLILIYQARNKLAVWSKYEALTRDYDILAKIK